MTDPLVLLPVTQRALRLGLLALVEIIASDARQSNNTDSLRMADVARKVIDRAFERGTHEAWVLAATAVDQLERFSRN